MMDVIVVVEVMVVVVDWVFEEGVRGGLGRV